MSERGRARRDTELDPLSLGGPARAADPAADETPPGPLWPQAYTNRYEIKYLVPARDLRQVRSVLSGLLAPDANNGQQGGYVNQSVYFDSPHYRYYTEKHEGELARIKPRIRFYRSALGAEASSVFLEFKGRYDRIVAKRRLQLTKAEADDLLNGGTAARVLQGHQDAVAREFIYLCDRYNLQPCVMTVYNREAFHSDFYGSLRVTFDTRFQCSLATRADSPPAGYIEALPGGETVLEVKYNEQVPKILISRLNSLGLQQRTFSKFAVALERCFDQFRSRRFRSSRFQ